MTVIGGANHKVTAGSTPTQGARRATVSLGHKVTLLFLGCVWVVGASVWKRMSGDMEQEGHSIIDGMNKIPVVYPSKKDMKDMMSYIGKIAELGHAHGVVKVVPPAGWSPGPLSVDTEGMRFNPRIQRLRDMNGVLRQSREYGSLFEVFMKQHRGEVEVGTSAAVGRETVDLIAFRDAAVVKGVGVREAGRGAGLSRRAVAAFENELSALKENVMAFEEFRARVQTAQARAECEDGMVGAVPLGFEMPSARAWAGKGMCDEVGVCRTCGVKPRMNLARGGGDKYPQSGACARCEVRYHRDCVEPQVDWGGMSKAELKAWVCPNCLSGCGGVAGWEPTAKTFAIRSFERTANGYKNHWVPDASSGLRDVPRGGIYTPPVMPEVNVEEELEVEELYWDLVKGKAKALNKRWVPKAMHRFKSATRLEHGAVLYGADIPVGKHRSGFPVSKAGLKDRGALGFNLNYAPFASQSLLRFVDSFVSGMMQPWLYMGMIFSTFCWHAEDHFLFSVSYLHLGDTKTWYVIPGKEAEAFERVMASLLPELFASQPDLMTAIMTIIPPEILLDCGVPVHIGHQRAGEFMVTFPRAYHSGFSHGFNLGEAVNVAHPSWLPMGAASVLWYKSQARVPVFDYSRLLLRIAKLNRVPDVASALLPHLTELVECELEFRAHARSLVWGHPDEITFTGDEVMRDYLAYIIAVWNVRLHDHHVYRSWPTPKTNPWAASVEHERTCAVCNAYTHLSWAQCMCGAVSFCWDHAWGMSLVDGNVCSCRRGIQLATRYSDDQLREVIAQATAVASGQILPDPVTSTVKDPTGAIQLAALRGEAPPPTPKEKKAHASKARESRRKKKEEQRLARMARKREALEEKRLKQAALRAARRRNSDAKGSQEMTRGDVRRQRNEAKWLRKETQRLRTEREAAERRRLWRKSRRMQARPEGTSELEAWVDEVGLMETVDNPMWYEVFGSNLVVYNLPVVEELVNAGKELADTYPEAFGEGSVNRTALDRWGKAVEDGKWAGRTLLGQLRNGLIWRSVEEFVGVMAQHLVLMPGRVLEVDQILTAVVSAMNEAKSKSRKIRAEIEKSPAGVTYSIAEDVRMWRLSGVEIDVDADVAADLEEVRPGWWYPPSEGASSGLPDVLRVVDLEKMRARRACVRPVVDARDYSSILRAMGASVDAASQALQDQDELAKAEPDRPWCFCRQYTHESESTMIGCDGCNEWFHKSCVLPEGAPIPSEYLCALCRPETPGPNSFVHFWTTRPSLATLRAMVEEAEREFDQSLGNAKPKGDRWMPLPWTSSAVKGEYCVLRALKMLVTKMDAFIKAARASMTPHARVVMTPKRMLRILLSIEVVDEMFEGEILALNAVDNQVRPGPSSAAHCLCGFVGNPEDMGGMFQCVECLGFFHPDCVKSDSVVRDNGSWYCSAECSGALGTKRPRWKLRHTNNPAHPLPAKRAKALVFGGDVDDTGMEDRGEEEGGFGSGEEEEESMSVEGASEEDSREEES